MMDPSEDEFEVALAYRMPDGTYVRIPFLPRLPDHFRSFVEQAQSELSVLARRTVSVLRWRTNQRGSHNPFSWRGFYWSYDRDFWHPAPVPLGTGGVEVSFLLQLPAPVREEVSRMVADGGSGPLQHDLFREAWNQRLPNPRSAIVIGMAAAELAMKKVVSELVPDAEWMAMHLPTPPLVRMLTEYLPRLPVRLKIGGKVKPPPKAVLDALRKGVTIRNEMAHAGAKGPSLDDVEEVLHAVFDLLWLVDYYSGQEWALGYLRAETKAALEA